MSRPDMVQKSGGVRDDGTQSSWRNIFAANAACYVYFTSQILLQQLNCLLCGK